MSTIKNKLIDPIMRKELRMQSRTVKFSLGIMFFNLILAMIAVIYISVLYVAYTYDGDANYGNYAWIFEFLGWTEFGITLLIVPALTAGTISGEREKQTLDIMLTTPVKPMQIIMGKLKGALSIFLMYIITSMPILAIAFIIGGMSWWQLIVFTIMICVAALYSGSIGVFCSAAFKKTIVSVIMTYILEILFYGVPYMILFGAAAVAAMVVEYLNYFQGLSIDLYLGPLGYLALLNPFSGFLDMTMRRFDSYSIGKLFEEMDCFGVVLPTIAEYAWLPLNILVCVLISFCFICLASNRLNPLRGKRKRKKKNQKVQKVEARESTQMVERTEMETFPYVGQTQELNKTITNQEKD